MDLSAYINFTLVMNTNGTLQLRDVSNYPGGVPPLIKGCFTVIKQPDGIQIGNSNFSSPDISWTGSGLNTFNALLRLNTAGSFQTGGYLITYQVQATGYTPTTLTKTFPLSYARPVPVILPNFDDFTPNLSLSDGTTYTQSGMNLASLSEAWSVLITSVNGTPQTITGAGSTFSLVYTGNYYDSNYLASLTSIVTYTLANPYAWVTLIDTIVLSGQSFDAETPPSMAALRGYATALLAQTNAAVNNCNTYPSLQANYEFYMTIYTLLKERGCNNDFSGLSAYVFQLQQIANNNTTPPVTHTNLPIPAYDFGCGGGGGSTAWNSITGKPATVIIQWTVVNSGGGFPNSGQNVISDARLIGYNVWITRNNIQEFGYTKPLGSGTITFTNPFLKDDVIYIQSIPL